MRTDCFQLRANEVRVCEKRASRKKVGEFSMSASLLSPSSTYSYTSAV